MSGVGPIRSVVSPDARFSPWYRAPSVAPSAAAAVAANQAAVAQGMLAAYPFPTATAPYQSAFMSPLNPAMLPGLQQQGTFPSTHYQPYSTGSCAHPLSLSLSLSLCACVSTAPTPFCVFVYNLPAEADNTTLYRLFGPFGAISDVKAIRDYNTSKCKGFGFVNFTRLEDAWTAITALNGAMIDGCARPLQVSFKTAGSNSRGHHHQ
jgi:hypothetical protein